MALGFIKKVFSFGKDKPVETPADAAAETTAAAEAGALAEPGAAPAALPLETELPTEADLELLPLALLDPAIEAEPQAPGPSSDVPESIVPTLESVFPDVAVPFAATPPSVPPGHLPIKGGDEGAAAIPPQDASDNTSDTPIPSDSSPIATPEGAESPSPESISALEGGDHAPLPDFLLPKGFSAAVRTAEPAPVAPEPKLTWFQRLRAGLFRTSSQLTGQITALFTKRKLDDDTLQDLEDLLIQADLGVETAMRISGTLSAERYGRDVTGEDVARIMAAEITKVLAPVAKPLALDLSHKPHVILVVGVNGTGKTTTIGKLAAKLSGAGLKVMLAAGDTFRAAAIEQLKIWADRTGSEFVGTKLGADAAGLAYDAFEQARARKCDVLIIDTAGRLQNKAELMAELEKIVRVLGKLDPEAPHTVLQTLDATTGQNALNQVEIFRNVAGVSGLIMTKLDGTARGGILVAIAAKHKLPVYFIGVGEGVDDLEPFEAQDFAQAIAGLTQ